MNLILVDLHAHKLCNDYWIHNLILDSILIRVMLTGAFKTVNKLYYESFDIILMKNLKRYQQN